MTGKPLHGRVIVRSALLVIFSISTLQVFADDPAALLGSWSGRAAGPEGGPPTGDIVLEFSRDENQALTGTVTVVAEGGVRYSGTLSQIQLEDRILTATATFQLGPEFVLEVVVKGPLEGASIKGTFVVASQGQTMGDGTFEIEKLGSQLEN